jgi:hypothetical protein
MRWIITADHIGTNSHGVGDDENGKRVQTFVTAGDPLSYDFRLYDDDGNLYYEGRTNDINEDEERAFAPLDWARHMAGCTYMTYRQHGLHNTEWLEL